LVVAKPAFGSIVLTNASAVAWRVHDASLVVDRLPDRPLIVEVWSHPCAVVDGVLHDIHTHAVGRVITGYYQPPTRVIEGI